MKKLLLPIIVGMAFLISCGADSSEEILDTDIIDNPISAESNGEDEDKLPFFEFVDDVKEFGTITQGESVSMNFRFRNVGESNLIISSATGSCGCTVPEWPKEPILPGEEGNVSVTFNSAGKQGLQNKTITLIANTIPNTKVLAIKGEVLVPNSNE